MQDKIIDLKNRVQKAGGIVVKEENGEKFVLLVYCGNHQDWSFPKGHAEMGEDANKTMIREIKEETGLDVKIIRGLPKLEYLTDKGESVSLSIFLATPLDPSQPTVFEHEGDKVE